MHAFFRRALLGAPSCLPVACSLPVAAAVGPPQLPWQAPEQKVCAWHVPMQRVTAHPRLLGAPSFSYFAHAPFLRCGLGDLALPNAATQVKKEELDASAGILQSGSEKKSEKKEVADKTVAQFLQRMGDAKDDEELQQMYKDIRAKHDRVSPQMWAQYKKKHEYAARLTRIVFLVPRMNKPQLATEIEPMYILEPKDLDHWPANVDASSVWVVDSAVQRSLLGPGVYEWSTSVGTTATREVRPSHPQLKPSEKNDGPQEPHRTMPPAQLPGAASASAASAPAQESAASAPTQEPRGAETHFAAGEL